MSAAFDLDLSKLIFSVLGISFISITVYSAGLIYRLVSVVGYVVASIISL